MRVGDRVFLSGGHEIPPEWLSGADGYYGTIEKFIPGHHFIVARLACLGSSSR
jgi:hypothetical protein